MISRNFIAKTLAFVVATLCVYTAYVYNQKQVYRVSGSIFGSSYNIISPTYINDQVHQSIKDELNRIDLIASNYKNNSELSLINQAEINKKITISNDLQKIIESSIEFNKISNGAFDVTLGNTINQLGFGPEIFLNQRDKVIDYQEKFTINNNLFVKRDYFLIDLSAIAKGYAVDKIADLLDQLNFNNYFIDIGGEVIVKGNKHNQPWIIGIQDPSSQLIKPIMQIEHDSNERLSMATSGEYRNYYVKDAKTISHTINPKTLESISQTSLSVSVKGNFDCMSADAYATWFNVIGPTESLEIANSRQIAVMFIVKNSNGIEFRQSNYW